MWDIELDPTQSVHGGTLGILAPARVDDDDDPDVDVVGDAAAVADAAPDERAPLYTWVVGGGLA